LKTAVPPGACDCHVHVFGPEARYPFAAKRTYTPPDASTEELLALQKRLGLERVVIVQPSVYGTDNSCMLDALDRLGSRARGVAVIDAQSHLPSMKVRGVRGARVNLETAGVSDPATAQRLLEETAARVAPLRWHVQVFAKAKLLRDLPLRLAVPLVIDHFGLPADEDDVAWLTEQLRSGRVYVKLSAAHRVPIDLGPLARALIAANPERCLWGSDWPHPFSGGTRDPEEVQPFDAIDDTAALARVPGWAAVPALFRKILVDNPARLYDF
jgi:predicted TIM-barrel fold metal-dependent hydrolase